MITLSNVGKFYGEQTLFASVSLQLNAGERYGLVGANGSGKTTLLNMLSGDTEASEGAITVPQRLRLGVLQQDQFLYEDESILNVALMGNEALWEVTVAKERLLAASAEEFDADKFAQLEETFLHCDGYTAQARAGTILEGLGCRLTFTTIRSQRCPAASSCGSCSRRCWPVPRTCCCSTSRPTTSTSSRSAG